MLKSILVEESTLLKLSPTLENAVKLLSENATQNDYLILLIILILNEVDLYIKKSNDRGDSTLDFNFEQWKCNGAYEIPLEHQKYSQLNCTLVAIIVGDVVVLNLTSIDQSIRTRCFAVETLEYINLYSSDLSSRFMNIKKLSHKFKNTLTTPIRDEILNNMGVVNPSLLGLPVEIQEKIEKMLCKNSHANKNSNKEWWEAYS